METFRADNVPVPDKALLIGAQLPGEEVGNTEALLAELVELTESLGVQIAGTRFVKVREPHPHYLVGAGKARELMDEAKALGCTLIIFDNELTPGQQRNWEKECGLSVIDRQEVILDIFAERAHTKEAVLQVDLARMEYELPRLKRAWTHLSRQRGGGGATQRGEGEAQIELDSRIIRERIAKLKRELEEVVRHRQTQRKQRLKKPVPVAAIVGYTNAGKSSLLNRLTGAHVLAEDKLFATLDPTVRRMELPRGQTILLSDTVGFVRRLPHRLIEAFKATLEEAILADFLIHVVDASNPEYEEHIKTTLEVLHELGADTRRMITVFNKSDLVDPDTGRQLVRAHGDKCCLISTRTGEGIPHLLDVIEHELLDLITEIDVILPPDRFDLVAKFKAHAFVQSEEFLDDGAVHLHGALDKRLVGQFASFATPKP